MTEQDWLARQFEEVAMTSRAGGSRPSRGYPRTGIVLLILVIRSTIAIAEDTPLSLADLEAYRLALLEKTNPTLRMVWLDARRKHGALILYRHS